MKLLITYLTLISLLIVQKGYSQDIITIEDAVQIGLERNFGILIASNEAEIDRLNRTLGNAGFLPRIEAGASVSELFESEQVRENGGVTQTQDFESSLLSADVELGWTLFDGLKMFVSYQRLGELQRLGETMARIEIENTIKDIIQAYYEVVRQEKLLEVLRNSVEISQERYDIAQTKRELGSGTELELILAQSDLNSDRAEMIRQEVVLNNSKTVLIRLLDLEGDAVFDVISSIEMRETLDLDDLTSLFQDNNREMEAAKQRLTIANLEMKEIRRERYPEINFNMGYTHNREEFRNSLFLHEQTDGFFVGLTARINLFDGFNTSRRAQTAQIRQRNEQIRLNEENKILETALFAEYKNYSSALELVDLEYENLTLAESALEIALEQFRLATITSVELRETQNILFNTENRLIDAQYEAKISETELLRLSGSLHQTAFYE
jgi:outer membrane protein